MKTSLKLHLRLADRSDLVGLVACDRYAQTHETRVQQMAIWIERRCCVAALFGVSPVGFVVLDTSFFGNGFIPLLCVAEAHRRQGVGRALLKHVQSVCPTPKLFTSTNASNVVAQRLFVDAGFVPSGHIDNLDEGDTELLFFKSVAASHEAHAM